MLISCFMLLAATNDWFWNMQDSEWDFGVFSGIEGVEKPDPEIFKIAVKAAGNICPEQILHIGDNLRKDYKPARSLGMHALLIDRFSTPEAHTAKETGVPVVADLLEAQEYIMSMEDQIAIS
jgi:FMN phosphatase YigB (HAD superfamily)